MRFSCNNLVDRSGKGFRMKIESIRVSRNLRGDGKTVLKRRKFKLLFLRDLEKECSWNSAAVVEFFGGNREESATKNKFLKNHIEDAGMDCLTILREKGRWASNCSTPWGRAEWNWSEKHVSNSKRSVAFWCFPVTIAISVSQHLVHFNSALKIWKQRKIARNKSSVTRASPRPYRKPQQVPKLSRLWLIGEKFVREVGKLEQKLWENVWLKRGEEGREGKQFLPRQQFPYTSTVTDQRNPTV